MRKAVTYADNYNHLVGIDGLRLAAGRRGVGDRAAGGLPLAAFRAAGAVRLVGGGHRPQRAGRVGDPDAWFAIQTAGWGSTFDFGRSTLGFLGEALREGDSWIQVSVAWLVIAAVGSAVAAVAILGFVSWVVLGIAALDSG